MNKGIKVAIAGAGIYGSTIAIKLARNGVKVTLYDPLGILCAASVINQLRVHRGYHYPRSKDTINEILEARNEFINEFKDAIVKDTRNYYAIPYEGSFTSAEEYEKVCDTYSLPLEHERPEWINFDFIQKCYLVAECIYDPIVLKSLIEEKIKSLNIRLVKEYCLDEYKSDYDFMIWATYGISGSHMCLFEKCELQVAEKILIRLPPELHKKSLVIVDGPFTAFDPYGNSQYFQFGSARHTNHWCTSDIEEQIPTKYAGIINAPTYDPVVFSNFNKMVDDAKKAVPLCANAEYIGSRFTLRLVEDDPDTDKRILYIKQSDDRTFHVFSGKVVSAVKAANIMVEKIVNA
jgi:hypothetical protein